MSLVAHSRKARWMAAVCVALAAQVAPAQAPTDQTSATVTVLQAVPPKYHWGLARTRVFESNDVKVAIASDGTVTRAELVGKLPPSWDRSLLDAARAWRFAPVEEEGTERTTVVHFELRWERILEVLPETPEWRFVPPATVLTFDWSQAPIADLPNATVVDLRAPELREAAVAAFRHLIAARGRTKPIDIDALRIGEKRMGRKFTQRVVDSSPVATRHWWQERRQGDVHSFAVTQAARVAPLEMLVEIRVTTGVGPTGSCACALPRASGRACDWMVTRTPGAASRALSPLGAMVQAHPKQVTCRAEKTWPRRIRADVAQSPSQSSSVISRRRIPPASRSIRRSCGTEYSSFEGTASRCC
jgi:hypothetical protein